MAVGSVTTTSAKHGRYREWTGGEQQARRGIFGQRSANGFPRWIRGNRKWPSLTAADVGATGEFLSASMKRQWAIQGCTYGLLSHDKRFLELKLLVFSLVEHLLYLWSRSADEGGGKLHNEGDLNGKWIMGEQRGGKWSRSRCSRWYWLFELNINFTFNYVVR